MYAFSSSSYLHNLMWLHNTTWLKGQVKLYEQDLPVAHRQGLISFLPI